LGDAAQSQAEYDEDRDDSIDDDDDADPGMDMTLSYTKTGKEMGLPIINTPLPQPDQAPS
jgi:hypothetical protein